uniref:Uncharacterized protein n=2 Tax=Leptocylindrus danicus TaxID=163516 RepID=A0A7S2KE98_9STRA|mmetsp:Transcript_2140/g.3142  ORF Transcript_2140/g.3142 Transcript_2140/m.3142 type:complete len:155 (+) Transcript_2140:165-629(+)
MHSSKTLLHGDMCDLDEFMPFDENTTCPEVGSYSLILEDFKIPAKSDEMEESWFNLGFKASVMIDFMDYDFRNVSLGCVTAEIGTDVGTASQSSNNLDFTDEEIVMMAAIFLGTFFMCGVTIIYCSGRTRRREQEELKRARLMGEVVDWGVAIE